MSVKEKAPFWRTARTAKGISLTTWWGGRNMYRVAEYEGLLGNRKEASWDRESSTHTCCGSKSSWRHHKTCPSRAKVMA